LVFCCFHELKIILNNSILSARKTCNPNQLAEKAVYDHLSTASDHENYRLRNIVKLINETAIDGSWIFDTRYLDVRFSRCRIKR